MCLQYLNSRCYALSIVFCSEANDHAVNKGIIKLMRTAYDTTYISNEIIKNCIRNSNPLKHIIKN